MQFFNLLKCRSTVASLESWQTIVGNQSCVYLCQTATAMQTLATCLGNVYIENYLINVYIWSLYSLCGVASVYSVSISFNSRIAMITASPGSYHFPPACQFKCLYFKSYNCLVRIKMT